jgi:hypothetical protein
MSYEPNNSHYDTWFNSIQNGDKIELFERDKPSSLGLYKIKKNTENNSVNFTRTILKYNYWGYEYDEKNYLTIDSNKIKNYTYSEPTIECNNIDIKQSFDTWYDNIDENKMYLLKENSLWGKKLEGNYNARKYTDTRGEKIVSFKRETSIMSNFWDSDPDNDILISQHGINYFHNNCKCGSYSEYNYYPKSKELALAEEDALYQCSTRGWF